MANAMADLDTAQKRLIAHLDMDAFYASVELLRYPELRGRPVAIGGGRRHAPRESIDPLSGQTTRSFSTLADYVGRGVITTATYPARQFGIGGRRAKRVEPGGEICIVAGLDGFFQNPGAVDEDPVLCGVAVQIADLVRV